MTRRSLLRSLTAAALAFAVAGGITACGDDDVLEVCTSLPFEPFEFKDSWQDNKVVGFDVDVMHLVAEELGQTAKIIDTDFNAIDSGKALEDDRCEVVAAALSITSDREEVMAFSEPYYDADLALAVEPDSTIESMEDLDGKILGIQEDTTGADYAIEHQEEYGYETKIYPDLGALREALLFDPEVPAAINDVPLWNIEAKEERVVVLDRFDTGEQYGYAVAKDNEDLRDTINQVLDESREDGRFAEIYEEWIGEEYPGEEASG
ncbi:MAG: ABC transporter substrate-binding protein [Stackebrandtia sp.]